MSRYIDRVVSLTLGGGPRLRPRPRYRFGAAPQRAQREPEVTMQEEEALASTHAAAVIAAAPHTNAPAASYGDAASSEPAAPQAFEVQDAARAERLLPLDATVPSLRSLQPIWRADDSERSDAAPPDASVNGSEPPARQSLRPLPGGAREIARGQPAPGDALETASAADVARARRAARNHDEAAPPAPRVRPAAVQQSTRTLDDAPVVMVRIGHIDVHATSAQSAASAPARRVESGLRAPSLDAYLRTRDRGRP
ncbi:hypothetical protein [Paraburkholderia sp. 35.1]|uniref:hypothetical protein n=1 Tax=Paraburkholderia sp. 35.1 TaxID=2991058 RepID=UPI003D258B36